MTEEFLHFVWKHKLFNASELKTTTGEKIEILKIGDHNSNAGPDFFNSKIKISDTVWAGNVEIHINSSDWYQHNHQHDEAYNNVILHVVHSSDQEVKVNNNTIIPTLELKSLINNRAFSEYISLKEAAHFISCKDHLKALDPFYLKSWQERLLVERLESKSSSIERLLAYNKNNWEETFYQVIARNFGFKINADPFEMLARSLPLSVLSKYKQNLFQLEALLFGQAGFLNEFFNDEYPRKLQNEYSYLQKKHQLIPLQSHIWKYLRLRPVNFPTVRIAQFSSLIFKSSALFSKVIAAENTKQIIALFEIETSQYWINHYQFSKGSNEKQKSFGKDSVNNIIINTIVPFLFVYGKFKGDEIYVERATSFLEEIRNEKNSIIEQWEEAGVKIKSAFESQAMIQLKNEYCNRKKCINCSIGNKILRTTYSPLS